MRTEISRNFQLEAAHRLPNVPAGHKCERLHGHSFQVTVHVSGDVDPHMGWVVDFAEITRAWQPMHELLDHRYLNDVPGLENPTSEHLARFILSKLRVPGARVSAVSVAETCNARCIVYADDV